MSEQEIISHLASSVQKAKALNMQRVTLSPMEARLYLTVQSTEGTQIMGIMFVKEVGSWKIERETAMPDNETGEQWVKLFLEQ